MSMEDVRAKVELGLTEVRNVQAATRDINEDTNALVTHTERAKQALIEFLRARDAAQEIADRLPQKTGQLPEQTRTAAIALHEAAAGTNQFEFSDCAYRCDALPEQAVRTNEGRETVSQVLGAIAVNVTPEDLDTIIRAATTINTAGTALNTEAHSILETAQQIRY